MLCHWSSCDQKACCSAAALFTLPETYLTSGAGRAYCVGMKACKWGRCNGEYVGGVCTHCGDRRMKTAAELGLTQEQLDSQVKISEEIVAELIKEGK